MTTDAGTGRKRVAVLISGRGSNMTALIKAAQNPAFPAEIALVVSNKADAKGLETAEAAGIATRVVPYKGHADRDSHDAAIQDVLCDAGIEIVALAGYMRLLTPDFVQKWAGRMINIHPALLPSFKGLDTHRRALEAGVREHGCTVHFVTPAMDEGPIIAQTVVPVEPSDTEDTLAARVLAAEHATYPHALAMVARGDARMGDDGTVVFRS